MAKVRTTNSSGSKKPSRPPLSPEAREKQMISLAVDLAEQQLRDGTASSQVITHFLKLATTKERLETEILEKQKDLVTAKTKAVESTNRSEELLEKALSAFRKYSGQGDADD